MGFFDALVSSSFKEDGNNHWLFYPWGTFSRGYRIHSESKYKILRRKVTIWYYFLFPLIFLILFLNLIGKIIFVSLLITIYALWAKRQCRKLAPVDRSLTINDSFSNAAREQNLYILWILVFLSIIMLLVSFFIFFIDSSKWILALIGLICFGFALTIFVWMILMKRKNLKMK